MIAARRTHTGAGGRERPRKRTGAGRRPDATGPRARTDGRTGTDGRGRSAIRVGKNELTFPGTRQSPRPPPASSLVRPGSPPLTCQLRLFWQARLVSGPCRNEPWPSSGQLSSPRAHFHGLNYVRGPTADKRQAEEDECSCKLFNVKLNGTCVKLIVEWSIVQERDPKRISLVGDKQCICPEHRSIALVSQMN